MKKFLTVWGLLLFNFDNKLFTGEKVCSLQRSVFITIENLFDTIHDAGKKTTLNIYQMVKISGTP